MQNPWNARVLLILSSVWPIRFVFGIPDVLNYLSSHLGTFCAIKCVFIFHSLQLLADDNNLVKWISVNTLIWRLIFQTFVFNFKRKNLSLFSPVYKLLWIYVMVHVQMSPLIHVLDSSNRGSIAYDCLAFIMNNEACFRVVRNWHQFASSPTWLSNSLEVTGCTTTAHDLL